MRSIAQERGRKQKSPLGKSTTSTDVYERFGGKAMQLGTRNYDTWSIA